jgi:hypothetical protein
MSVTARFLAFLFACHMQSSCPPCSQVASQNVNTLHQSRRLFSVSLTFGATLSSPASGNSFKRRHCGRSASSSPSIHRSTSTASGFFVNSLLTLRSRRPFERVFFFLCRRRRTRPHTVTVRSVDKMTALNITWRFHRCAVFATSSWLRCLFVSASRFVRGAATWLR